MYPFMASFYNKIANYVSQGLERGHMCRFLVSLIVIKIGQDACLVNNYCSGEFDGSGEQSRAILLNRGPTNPLHFYTPHNKVVRGVYWNQLGHLAVGCPSVFPCLPSN
jgi:hypothetical protein